MRPAALFALVLWTGSALAQQSATYHVSDRALNAGGRPAGGAICTSPSYRVTLDALGEAAARPVLAAASYRVDAGFAAAYPPPGEVRDLRFSTSSELRWATEPSVGAYELYRGAIGTLPGTYGTCLQAAITAESWNDPTIPAADTGLFYLATAVNRLGEKGTKGTDSSGAERERSPGCP